MPLFKVCIETVERYTGHIVVEGNNVDDALTYVNKNHEWLDYAGAPSNGERWSESYAKHAIPLQSMRDIESLCPPDSIPWNGTTEKTIQEILVSSQ